MRSVIIGYGEIGKSLFKILSPFYNVGYIDLHEEYDVNSPEILHICFGYSDKFVEQVKNYQERFKPKFTVVHSTVPLGTCRELNAVFSMVVGVHPFLEESLKTFTKFLAGEQASQVANYFRKAGLKVYLYDKQETLELAKISQTTFYAVMIEYIKNLKKECDKNNLNFTEVYSLPSQDYNSGYDLLGRPEYKMPMLVPIQTPQGGHCTIPNLEFWDTPFTKLVKELNGQS